MKGKYLNDESYIREGFKSYRATANSVQSKLLKSDEAKSWWAKNKDKVFDQSIEYPVLEAAPLVEKISGKYEIINPDSNRESLQDSMIKRSLNESLIIDLFWWNMQNSPSVLHIKLDKKILRLIYLRYIENGTRSCKEVSKLSGFAISTIYRFFCELRKVIREELLNKAY